MNKIIFLIIMIFAASPACAAVWSLSDPGYDAIVLWDYSETGNEVTWLQIKLDISRDISSQSFSNGETQTTVTEAHMLGAKWITDQGGSAETDLILTAVSYYIQCTIFETEGNGFEICPPSGEAIYLNGSAIAQDDCVDGGGNIGDSAVLIRAQIADGSYRYFLNTVLGTWSNGNDTGD